MVSCHCHAGEVACDPFDRLFAARIGSLPPFRAPTGIDAFIAARPEVP